MDHEKMIQIGCKIGPELESLTTEEVRGVLAALFKQTLRGLGPEAIAHKAMDFVQRVVT